jgi:hypothetical protein
VLQPLRSKVSQLHCLRLAPAANYSSSHKYVPIGYKYISGIRTNHFDNFVNVLGEVKRKN